MAKICQRYVIDVSQGFFVISSIKDAGKNVPALTVLKYYSFME